MISTLRTHYRQALEALNYVAKNAVFPLGTIPERPWDIVNNPLLTPLAIGLMKEGKSMSELSDVERCLERIILIERDNQQLRKELRAANKGAETNAHINLTLIKEKNQLHTVLKQCAEALRHAQTILIDEQIDKALALPAVQAALKEKKEL